MPALKPKTVDEYINAAPVEAQEKLIEIRSILKQVAPKATEAIKWGSPVFEENESFLRIQLLSLTLILCRPTEPWIILEKT